jgi:hypothetical protein
VRRASTDLRSGSSRSVASPSHSWAWRRGERTTIAVNLSDRPVRIDVGDAVIALSTDRTRDGERVGGTIELGPWTGAVLVADER